MNIGYQIELNQKILL